MDLEVRRVRGRRELERFVRLPWSIYAGDPAWVPPLRREVLRTLDSRHNPFFEHGTIEPWLAHRDGEVVGRIAAIRNGNHERVWNDGRGFFGFFESIDDASVATALVDAARDRCRDWGLEVLRGPVSPSTNDECGTLVDGFGTPPAVLMPHGRPYYDRLLGDAGLTGAKDLLAYWLDTPREAAPERLRRASRIARARNPEVSFRAFRKKDFAAELERFKAVYNRAWEKNWGFVPMTDAEIDHMAASLRPVIDPGLVRIAEHGDRPVGFALALPDLNQALRHADGRLFPLGLAKILWHARHIDSARVMVLGVVEEYRGRGLDAVLYEELYEHGIRTGLRGAELSWVLEDNRGIRKPIEEAMGARPYKTYRIYEMPVGAP